MYIPPALHSSGFTALSEFLLNLPHGPLIIGGDFNTTLNDALDRTPPRRQYRTHAILTDFINALGLIDIWRTQFPSQQQYTHHSAAHSLSRIDYLLAPATELGHFHSVTHLPRGISDHSPISVQYTLHHKAHTRTFPIYPGFLRSPQIGQSLIDTTKHYFEENTLSVASPTVLWEAYKTVFRGQAISLITHHKREKVKTIETLEKQVADLEKSHGQDPNAASTHTLQLKKCKYAEYLREEAKTRLTKTLHTI